MQPTFKDLICPVCLHHDVAEHIEVASADSRAKSVDRRSTVDLAYLSLIEFDRRASKSDRRGIHNGSTVVEHTGPYNMVCLVCAHEWYIESSCISDTH